MEMAYISSQDSNLLDRLYCLCPEAVIESANKFPQIKLTFGNRKLLGVGSKPLKRVALVADTSSSIPLEVKEAFLRLVQALEKNDINHQLVYGGLDQLKEFLGEK